MKAVKNEHAEILDFDLHSQSGNQLHGVVGKWGANGSDTRGGDYTDGRLTYFHIRTTNLLTGANSFCRVTTRQVDVTPHWLQDIGPRSNQQKFSSSFKEGTCIVFIDLY